MLSAKKLSLNVQMQKLLDANDDEIEPGFLFSTSDCILCSSERDGDKPGECWKLHEQMTWCLQVTDLQFHKTRPKKSNSIYPVATCFVANNQAFSPHFGDLELKVSKTP